ncbi:MAG: hypothetical protein J6583_10185 [Gilliamella sp.]|nr:hypothetical protein [Gilliamella sp.]
MGDPPIILWLLASFISTFSSLQSSSALSLNIGGVIKLSAPHLIASFARYLQAGLAAHSHTPAVATPAPATTAGAISPVGSLYTSGFPPT